MPSSRHLVLTAETPGISRRAAVVAFLLFFFSSGRAGDATPPVDEWWKRATPPAKHGPISWSVGAFWGKQNWVGLEDCSPTESERAAGWEGAFGTTSPTWGVVGSIEGKRLGTTGFGIDFFVDTFSTETTEPSYRPEPGVSGVPRWDVKLNVWRVGAAGRFIFRSASRVQPTVALGLAFAQVQQDSTSLFYHPGSSYVTSGQSFGSHSTSFDMMLTGGFDVALEKHVRRGWRLRFEAGVEHRGEEVSLLGNTAGPLAYKAVVGILYRYEPKTQSP